MGTWWPRCPRKAHTCHPHLYLESLTSILWTPPLLQTQRRIAKGGTPRGPLMDRHPGASSASSPPFVSENLDLAGGGLAKLKPVDPVGLAPGSLPWGAGAAEDPRASGRPGPSAAVSSVVCAPARPPVRVGPQLRAQGWAPAPQGAELGVLAGLLLAQGWGGEGGEVVMGPRLHPLWLYCPRSPQRL